MKEGGLGFGQLSFQPMLFYEPPGQVLDRLNKMRGIYTHRHPMSQVAPNLHLVVGMKCWAQGLSEFLPVPGVKSCMRGIPLDERS